MRASRSRSGSCIAIAASELDRAGTRSPSNAGRHAPDIGRRRRDPRTDTPPFHFAHKCLGRLPSPRPSSRLATRRRPKGHRGWRRAPWRRQQPWRIPWRAQTPPSSPRPRKRGTTPSPRRSWFGVSAVQQQPRHFFDEQAAPRRCARIPRRQYIAKGRAWPRVRPPCARLAADRAERAK